VKWLDNQQEMTNTMLSSQIKKKCIGGFWLSGNRLLAVARLTATEGFHAQACYHAGQAAEKALDTTTLQALPLKH
jgi:hypothetical protein